MANGQHYTKFFWNDWDTDPALNMCDPINQYLWFKMLGIASRHDPPGLIGINNRPLNHEDIARVIGWDKETVKAGVEQLDKAGVFSRRQKDGMMYSRRMVRDHEVFQQCVAAGKLGGNPMLRKAKENSASLNGGVAQTVKDKQKQKQKQKEEKVPSRESFSSDSEVVEQGAARVASLEVASLPRPPTFEEFQAAYPFNWGEVDEQYGKVLLGRWRDLDDRERRLAVSEIPTLLAWVNEAPSDPERVIFYPETWLGARQWMEVWRRAPHLNPNARTNSGEQPESENAA